MVRPAGPLLATPPATSSFVNWRSHPLSYGRKKLDARVRFERTLCTALQAVAQPRLVVRTRDDGGCSREAGCAEFFRRSGATANKNCVQDAPECATNARVGRRPPNDESRFHHSAIARIKEKRRWYPPGDSNSDRTASKAVASANWARRARNNWRRVSESNRSDPPSASLRPNRDK
jgi:hypothetical protein